tara:strand:- start:1082 stop:1264 length:183 start_codon:yes stop_codon:yes gene_type:complete
MPASQMAEILKQYIDMNSRELSARIKGAVAMKAGVQSRMTNHAKEYSINSHESLMAYLRD